MNSCTDSTLSVNPAVSCKENQLSNSSAPTVLNEENKLVSSTGNNSFHSNVVLKSISTLKSERGNIIPIKLGVSSNSTLPPSDHQSDGKKIPQTAKNSHRYNSNFTISQRSDNKSYGKPGEATEVKINFPNKKMPRKKRRKPFPNQNNFPNSVRENRCVLVNIPSTQNINSSNIQNNRMKVTSPEPKKAKLEIVENVTNSCITEDIELALIPSNYPDRTFTKEEANKLILLLLNPLSIKQTNCCPKFGGEKLEAGALIVFCIDDYSKDWLSKRVLECAPQIGIDIKTCDPKEIDPPTMVSVFLPKPIQSPEESLQWLENQNDGLSTYRWKIIEVKDSLNDDGTNLSLSIPNSSLNYIKESQMLLYHGLHIVGVDLLNEVKKE